MCTLYFAAPVQITNSRISPTAVTNGQDQSSTFPGNEYSAIVLSIIIMTDAFYYVDFGTNLFQLRLISVADCLDWVVSVV